VGSGCVLPFAGAVVGAAFLARFVAFFAGAFFAGAFFADAFFAFAGAFFFRIVMRANMSLHLDVSGNNLARSQECIGGSEQSDRPMHSTAFSDCQPRVAAAKLSSS